MLTKVKSFFAIAKYSSNYAVIQKQSRFCAIRGYFNEKSNYSAIICSARPKAMFILT